MPNTDQQVTQLASIITHALLEDGYLAPVNYENVEATLIQLLGAINQQDLALAAIEDVVRLELGKVVQDNPCITDMDFVSYHTRRIMNIVGMRLGAESPQPTVEDAIRALNRFADHAEEPDDYKLVRAFITGELGCCGGCTSE